MPEDRREGSSFLGQIRWAEQVCGPGRGDPESIDFDNGTVSQAGSARQTRTRVTSREESPVEIPPCDAARTTGEATPAEFLRRDLQPCSRAHPKVHFDADEQENGATRKKENSESIAIARIRTGMSARAAITTSIQPVAMEVLP